MPQYGEVRVDYITYTTGVSPDEANVTVTVSSLVNQPTFSGDVIIEGDLTVGGDTTITGDLTVDGTLSGNSDGGAYASGYWKIPAGGTAQRPTGALLSTGMIRYNLDLDTFEGYDGTWGTLGGGATGSGTDKVFILNEQTVNTSYTIPNNHNATSCGPITIVDSVEVVVGDGENWSIV